MPLPSCLLRRGAVYYWRRRTPRARGDGGKAQPVVLSLGTAELARARLSAAHLTVVAEAALRNAAMITEQQINETFRLALQAHVHSVTRWSRCNAADFDWRASARISEQWYWI
jgi:Domain of unknown function (DUF6538)